MKKETKKKINYRKKPKTQKGKGFLRALGFGTKDSKSNSKSLSAVYIDTVKENRISKKKKLLDIRDAIKLHISNIYNKMLKYSKYKNIDLETNLSELKAKTLDLKKYINRLKTSELYQDILQDTDILSDNLPDEKDVNRTIVSVLGVKLWAIDTENGKDLTLDDQISIIETELKELKKTIRIKINNIIYDGTSSLEKFENIRKNGITVKYYIDPIKNIFEDIFKKFYISSITMGGVDIYTEMNSSDTANKLDIQDECILNVHLIDKYIKLKCIFYLDNVPYEVIMIDFNRRKSIISNIYYKIYDYNIKLIYKHTEGSKDEEISINVTPEMAEMNHNGIINIYMSYKTVTCYKCNKKGTFPIPKNRRGWGQDNDMIQVGFTLPSLYICRRCQEYIPEPYIPSGKRLCKADNCNNLIDADADVCSLTCYQHWSGHYR